MSRRRLSALPVLALIASLAVPVPAAAVAQKVSSDGGRLAPTASKIAYIIEDMVADVAAARRAGRSSAALSHDFLHVTDAGEIELLFHGAGPVTKIQSSQIELLGGRVVERLTNQMVPALKLPPFGLVQAWVPFDKVEATAKLAWVVAVTPPAYAAADPHPNNGAVSEGVALHNADDAQTRGVTGAGVNVGVISDGVQSLATAQANNELPAVTVLDAGSNDEGTAMLEIVHDMAPGAGLIFDGGAAGLTDYVNAFAALVGAGSHVITEDLFFFNEPAFQQGLGAQTAENTAAAGVSVHSSAGNRGQTHTARVNAVGTGAGPDGGTGPFVGCNNPPDNVVAIAPGGDTTFDMQLAPSINGNSTAYTLQWSEPRAIAPSAGQGGFTDLNLYIMDATGTSCLGQSTGVQASGQGDTIEQVVMPGSLAGTNVKVVVDVQGTSSAVAAPLLDLRWNRGTNTDNPTRAGSINPDSNYTGLATSAAAVNANTGAIEAFSSAGPVQLVTTTQCPGGAAGPCTGAPGPAAVTANGPNWAAADGVQISGAGGFGRACAAGTCFFGTSASAPHAAACDALLRDELDQPAAAPANTNARLAATAIALGNATTIEGTGQLDCLAAINDPPVADIGGPYATDEGLPVTLDAAASGDPDTGDSLTYEWDLDDDGQFDDAIGVTAAFDLVGQDGAFQVAVRVTDTAGATDTDQTAVTVDNASPAVAFTASSPKNEGAGVDLAGLATDPGWLDGLTATVDWGDGSPSEALAGSLENLKPDASLLFGTAHSYGDNGTFTVEVCVEDDDTSTCETQSVEIENADPTAVIDKSGASLINGVQTLLAHAGESLNFSATVEDAGSDDLTMTWDWDDGAPAPDVSTLSLVNPPDADPPSSPTQQPRSETDLQAHAFADACMYDVGFAAADDDGGNDEDGVKVLITGNADINRGSGYWLHQYRGNGKIDFTTATLDCYLEITGFISGVFDEARDASTRAAAAGVLRTNGTSDATELLEEQLLAVWLNFANGAMDLADLVDTNSDGLPDVTLADALAEAEAVRLAAGATRDDLLAQKDKMESINLMDA